MPNFYTNLYNEFILSADEICDFLSGAYLSPFENATIACSPDGGHILGGMNFVKVAEYRKLADMQKNFDTHKAMLTGVLEGYHGKACPVGYVVLRHKGEISVFFASGDGCESGFDASFRGSIPDIVTENRFAGMDILKDIARYGGVVTGIASPDRTVIDSVIAQMKGDCILALLATPFTKSRAERYKAGLYALRETCESTHYERTFGRRTVKESFPGVSRLEGVIERRLKEMEKSGEGLWETCLWFTAEEKGNADALGKAIAAAYISEGTARCFDTVTNPFSAGKLFIPQEVMRSPRYPLEESLAVGSLISLVKSGTLAGCMQLPQYSHKGITVKATEHNPDEVYTFDRTSRMTEGVTIGEICESGIGYNINIQELVNHLLIVGGTGGGKTNTMHTLLTAVDRSKIPFCVIESSKKEYWKLNAALGNVRIYSCGEDAEPLCLNPLAPEEGVYIGNHIDDLMYAFSGAFDMETPTRAALQNLITYTYKCFGWETDDIAYKGKAFPQLKDVLARLPEFRKTQLSYGNEVSGNIHGAIENRLKTLVEGTVGRIVNCDTGISARELCSANTIVELDDIALSVKPFVANLLVIKMNQFLRQKDTDGRLKNLLVIEEAHNIFSEISQNGIKTSKELASEYFSNLMSEIRAYGTGMVIVDQGPVRINSNALANTALKIVHALNYEADATSVAYALKLSDYQKRCLTDLGVGEAVITRRGDSNVCKVKIHRAPEGECENLACLFCRLAPVCNTKACDFGISARIDLYAARIYSVRFDKNALREEIQSILAENGIAADKGACVLGYILSATQGEYSEKEKRRIIHMLK